MENKDINRILDLAGQAPLKTEEKKPAPIKKSPPAPEKKAEAKKEDSKPE